MANKQVVYLCVWSGDGKKASAAVGLHYPKTEIREFSHRQLRAGKLGEKVRLLHSFCGRGVVFYFAGEGDCKHRQILECFHLLHRCPETVLCDAAGRWESIRTGDVVRSAFGVLVSLLLDAKALVFWWGYLQFWHKRPVPFREPGSAEPQIAYLMPSPVSMGSGGGALSHIRGFLNGLRSAGISCRVFSGTCLSQEAFANEVVLQSERRHFFWGCRMLAYNFAFARGVERALAGQIPGFFYQRHLAFSISGAMLSRRLKVPLILEYNGSEVWVADHWDPNPLRHWIRLCEEVTLRYATRIVAVSQPLQAELLQRGVPAERIRVNPNGVDADYFYPGRGRALGREQLQVQTGEVLVGFVGSFSLWHGVEVLQRAIASLLGSELPCRLRFVLMGDGLLRSEMRSALAAYEATGQVIFTGPLPHDQVANYLDAADILVSPHVAPADGSPFFGSPTKLFEYMAAGKAIVASRLEQLAEVLDHEQTGLLITPGSVEELAEAILRLANDAGQREALGRAARRVAVEQHSWRRNVAWALSDLPRPRSAPIALAAPRSAGQAG